MSRSAHDDGEALKARLESEALKRKVDETVAAVKAASGAMSEASARLAADAAARKAGK